MKYKSKTTWYVAKIDSRWHYKQKLDSFNTPKYLEIFVTTLAIYCQSKVIYGLDKYNRNRFSTLYFFKNYFTVLCTCSWGTVRSFTHGVGLVPLMSLYQKYIFILSDEFMTFAMYITKKSCKILCNLLDFFVINIANVHVLLYFFPSQFQMKNHFFVMEQTQRMFLQ